jgi:hypothetical protein
MADNLALQVWKGTTQIGCAEKYCTPVRDPYGQWAWVSLLSSLIVLPHGPAHSFPPTGRLLLRLRIPRGW